MIALVFDSSCKNLPVRRVSCLQDVRASASKGFRFPVACDDYENGTARTSYILTDRSRFSPKELKRRSNVSATSLYVPGQFSSGVRQFVSSFSSPKKRPRPPALTGLPQFPSEVRVYKAGCTSDRHLQTTVGMNKRKVRASFIVLIDHRKLLILPVGRVQRSRPSS